VNGLETSRGCLRKKRLVVSHETEPDFAAQLGEIPDPAAISAAAPPVAPSLPKAPTRAEVRTRRVAALVASMGWLVAHLAVYGVRRDFSTLPLPYIAAQILVPLLVSAASLALALGRGRLGLGWRFGLVSAAAVLGPASFCVIAVGTPAPRALEPAASSLVGTVLCFDITVAWAAVPLFAAALVLRGAFAGGALWRSALLGAAIGLFAGATMNLHCPNVAPVHVLFGHGLAVILATLLGAFALVRRTRA